MSIPQIACKGVIFDLFGTLVGHFSVKENEAFLLELSRLLGVVKEKCSEEWQALASDALIGRFTTVEDKLRALLRNLNATPSEAVLGRARRLKLDHARELLKERPGAIEILSYLQGEGYALGLISACGPDVVELWQECPLRQYFPSPIFSCEAKVNKPDRRIYEICCDRLGVSIEECIYVGDGTGQELTGARECNMQAILLRTPLDDVYDPVRDDVKEWNGSVIDRLLDLKDVVRFG